MPIVNGLYNGVRYVGFSADNQGALACTRFIYGITEDNAENSIISVFMAPLAFWESQASGGTLPQGSDLQSDEPYTKRMTISMFKSNKMFDGYLPINKKLYTFPFCALALDTLSCCTVYRWEWFTSKINNDVRFEIVGAISPNTEFRISPINYCCETRQQTDHEEVNYTYSNFVTGFPQCAWAIDSYAAWMAQKSTAEYLNMASSALGAIGAFAQGNIQGGIQGGIGIAQQYNQMVLEQSRGDTPRGNIGGMVDTAAKIKGAYFKSMTITKEYAQQIDSFFSRYGYCVNRLKKPSRRNRTYYTYTKTQDCQIKLLGTKSIPADAVEKIKSIYNNGVTFWTDQATPGDYMGAGSDNHPLGGGD